ncbi:Flp family type IVb pilin [Comamonas sp. NyZ500]|uniref:Pilus subunit protein PilA n=1 Tax=Comamonas thiooxydans TaxID=363952 RepID=A0A0E3BFQ4_9BURK|nr:MULTISPECIES: Flp family type IVb pilin [Comamonas]KGG92100.1 pilus subunit protein PilA [Comamonas thiooxydans]MBL5976072.1 Flp family type IVb pilin [Comamonas sp. NyZ500]
MNMSIQKFGNYLQSFLNDEEGAQVIEYALVVAVVSIALVIFMKSSIGSTLFDTWLARVSACLGGAGACV